MPRRSPGEGSISERTLPSGKRRFVAQLTVNGERRAKVCATRAEAVRALGELRIAAAAGVQRQKSLTVGEFLEQWLADVVTPRVKPRTLESYRQRVRDHYAPLAPLPLRSVTPQRVQELQTALLTRLSPASTAITINVLSSAFQVAEDWDLIARNPVRRIRRASVPRAHRTAITEAEARAVLAAFDPGDRYGGAVILTLLMGLRQGEVIGLRWADVGKETLTIAGQYTRAGVHAPTKTNSVAVLPLLPRAAALLAAQRQRQLLDRLAAGGRWQDTGYVFTRAYGTPLRHRDLFDAYHKGLAAAGLPLRRYHDLRRATATLLGALGVHPSVAAAILRHLRVSETLDTYTSVDAGSIRTALAELEAALEG